MIDSQTIAPLRIFSFGGGVQSTAALVLAAQGKIDYRTFLFCNVGDDSENPDTITYVNEIAKPYAKEHGIELIELQRTDKSGNFLTLYQQITRPGIRSMGIPVRMANGAPGRRACTGDFKIKVIVKWVRQHGATRDNPAIVGLGISMDEFQRMRSGNGIVYEKLAYPLIELRLNRADCIKIIQDAGLPVPSKSSCYFCPYHSLNMWQELRDNQPELFQKVCDLETIFNQRRAAIGKDGIFFNSRLKPLAQITTDHHQNSLFDDKEEDMCESGYCFM